MKKIFYVSTIIAILIMLSGCGTTKSKLTINNPNNITKITVTTQPRNEKTTKEYVHFGNMFFKESGKGWYEIPYKQADKFDNIYKNLGNK